ncbi:MAG: hypothetical protein F6K36_11130 [Symploca sp. SIO3C6]|uniref:Uncharacterized protein n=1 Tax=Symploca sp. SIO1C4 TaxID=2607765 RepID=A0A6B3NLX9_9CYAN|nr:hypothetical protein [Symploca sp. SIO3C6]NER30198.1 hypothetical protein [Symploca sp. SIO1C4]
MIYLKQVAVAFQEPVVIFLGEASNSEVVTRFYSSDEISFFIGILIGLVFAIPCLFIGIRRVNYSYTAKARDNDT